MQNQIAGQIVFYDDCGMRLPAKLVSTVAPETCCKVVYGLTCAVGRIVCPLMFVPLEPHARKATKNKLGQIGALSAALGPSGTVFAQPAVCNYSYKLAGGPIGVRGGPKSSSGTPFGRHWATLK